MTKIRLLPLLAAITCASQAHALGLGNPQVESYLGEPLRISAPIFLSPEEREQLGLGSVSVAKPEVFQRFRVPYRQIHSQLDLSVELVGNQATLTITTPFSFAEPYLEVPLDIQIGDNHLLKVVNLLIDPRPPEQDTPRSPRESEAVATRPTPSSSAVRPSSTRLSVPPVEVRSTQRPTGVLHPQVVDGRYGPVAVNQTLSDIAKEVGPEGATVYQSLVALWEANPDAFLHGNMNYLKAGSTLRIPSREEVLSHSATAARQEVVDQYAASKGERPVARRSESPASAQDAVPATPAPASGERVTAEAPTTPAAAPEQQLEIVVPPSADDVPAEFKEDFTALTAQLSALNSENNELRQRVTDLEQRIATMSELMLAEAPLPAVDTLPQPLPPATPVAEPVTGSAVETPVTQSAPPETANIAAAEDDNLTAVETPLASTTSTGDSSQLLRYGILGAVGLGLLLFAGLWVTRTRQRAKYRQLLKDTSSEHLF